jgi:ribosome-associated protein
LTPETVPLHEIEFRTSHASGPGGQNVNKLETRVEARWNIDLSAALSAEERARLKEALGPRIGAHGILRVSSQRHRSQFRNKQAAIERLRSLVAEALKPRKKRRPTSPTRKSEEVRIAEKKRRGLLKRLRGGRPGARSRAEEE